MNKFFETYLSDKPEIVAELRELDHLSCEGKITYDEFLGHIVELSGVPRSEAKEFLDRNPTNQPLFEYISTKLKPFYKIGFLSNAADDWLTELFSPEQLGVFDDFVLSYQHNMRKPDIAIFSLAAQRLDVSPHECLFVDDIEAYCQGARESGITAVQYKSIGQFREDIEPILR